MGVGKSIGGLPPSGSMKGAKGLWVELSPMQEKEYHAWAKYRKSLLLSQVREMDNPEVAGLLQFINAYGRRVKSTTPT